MAPPSACLFEPSSPNSTPFRLPRPPPAWRTSSAFEARPAENIGDPSDNDYHPRRKSAHSAPVRNRRVSRPSSRDETDKLLLDINTHAATDRVVSDALTPVREYQDSKTLTTPPETPENKQRFGNLAREPASTGLMLYDFSKIDYEIDRTRAIGQGLWSTVFLAQPTVKSPQIPHFGKLTPPATPSTNFCLPPCRLYAVKTRSRNDAGDVFQQEAKTLTKLQRHPNSHCHIVPFHGLDPRNTSLIFEAAIGGSLDDLTKRLKVMTEVSRHLELRNIFPGLAGDLIGGLDFIHAADIVHADIKPANILLDIASDHTVRARYIDFSAAFTPSEDSCANAGGTWDFMAPEQLRIQKELNTPTPDSDVWSLGITLFSIIVGGSPYAAASGRNVFMLREAIKGGEPLAFARMDGVVQKRMAACQDFVDCCRLGLQKDREKRVTAKSWSMSVQGDVLSE